MTIFNLGTNTLNEGEDFVNFDPYFPAPGFTYFLRASLNQSSYLTFAGYVLILTEFQIPGPQNFRSSISHKVYPSPIPVFFPVDVYTNLPAGVIFRNVARLIKPFRGNAPDNIIVTLEFDDNASQAL